MVFNSVEFLLFLPAVWTVYWALGRRLRLQNLLVVVASYVFYGWWDWRFLLLIAFTSAWSYVVGLLELHRWEAKPSRALLTISLIVNLGILGVFKYYDFFVNSFVSAFGFLFPGALSTSTSSLHLILPVGISFYTFQALSYTIDVYRRNIRPTRDPFAFFAFISFFPQLVAGPIERATNLLPQFLARREFDYAESVAGCRQMLWGFFKKVVVADNCAVVANALLNGTASDNGLVVWTGVFFFTFQIYGDFSGYSDIAIGVSRLFGIRLMRNFAFPYFARDIAEFWRRWHISLTTWFRDYLYIPLGGSRGTKAVVVRNTFVIFLVSGLWHGADWTFVLWGVFHALLFLPLILSSCNRRHLDVVAAARALPTFPDLVRILSTFAMVVLGWAFFRARSLAELWAWLQSMFNPLSFSAVEKVSGEHSTLALIGVMVVVEWMNRREPFGCARLPSNTAFRWLVYVAFVFVFISYKPDPQPFIYFQF